MSVLHAQKPNARRARKISSSRVLSHELRTPLHAVLGWVQVLKLDLNDQNRVAAGVTVIERNARQQSKLIADLLDVSRITSGALRLDMQTVVLEPIIEAAIEAVMPAAAASGIAIHRHFDRSTTRVA